MLKFLSSIANWIAKNHGVTESRRPIGSTTNTPSTPKTSGPKPENLVGQSPSLSPAVDIRKKERAMMIKQLTLHEGLKFKAYLCSAGKVTIGVGRNLEDRGITQEESDFLLSNDIDDFQERLEKALPWMVELDPVRQRVLLDMSFNLGISGLLTFKRTLAAIKGREFTRASVMMLDSRWARQVGQRAKRLSQMMNTGEVPPELRID